MPAEQWRIDWEYPDTIRNWVDPEKLNVTCVAKSKLGLFGSMFFVGWAIGAAIIPQQSRKYGKNRILFFCMSVQQLAFTVIIFWCKDINLMIFLYFICGLMAGGNRVVCTTYFSDFITKKN